MKDNKYVNDIKIKYRVCVKIGERIVVMFNSMLLRLTGCQPMN